MKTALRNYLSCGGTYSTTRDTPVAYIMRIKWNRKYCCILSLLKQHCNEHLKVGEGKNGWVETFNAIYFQCISKASIYHWCVI